MSFGLSLKPTYEQIENNFYLSEFHKISICPEVNPNILYFILQKNIVEYDVEFKNSLRKAAISHDPY